MNQTLRSLSVSALLAYLLTLGTGCGSSTSATDPGVANSPAPTISDFGVAPSLSGRLFPGIPLGGATVTVADANGRIQLSTTTDPQGFFQFEEFTPPANFRVRAVTLQGDEFAAVVRDHPGGGRYVVLNVPTTLIDALGGSEQAEARVRAYLGIPDQRTLEYGLAETGVETFSHLDFFVQAAAQGGWAAYRNKALGELGGTTNHSYQVKILDLTASLSGLEASLSGPLNQIRSSRATRRAILNALARRRPDMLALALDGSRESPATTFSPKEGGGFVGFVGGRLLDTLLDQSVDVAWTHIADGLSINYGTTAILLDIQATVDKTYQLLNELTIDDAKDDLQSVISALNSSIIVTHDTYEYLTSTNNSVSTNLSNPEVPINVASSVNALTGKLVTVKTDVNLQLIQVYMLGSDGNTNFLKANRDYLLNLLRGLSVERSGVGYFPMRSQSTLDLVFSSLHYYGSYQEAAGYSIAEAAHLTNPAIPGGFSTNPYAAMVDAQQSLTHLADSLRQQQAQYPQSAEVVPGTVVDLDAGLMWYDTVQSARSLTSAISVADSFTLSHTGDHYSVNYTDWRLPTVEEMRTLQDRGRLVNSSLRDSSVKHNGSDSSEGVTGYSATGLTELGFKNVNILNSNGDALVLAYDYLSHQNPPRYDLTGTTPIEGNPEFRLNVGPRSQQTTDTRPFFMVRSIGKPVIPIDQDGLVAVDSGPPIPFTYTSPTPDDMRVLGEISGVGQIKLMAPAGSSSTLPDQLGTQVTLTLNVGGSYKMGPNNETSRSYPTRTTTATFNTYASNDGGQTYTSLNDLAKRVYFSTNNTDVNLRPSGKLFWKSSGFGGFNLSALTSARKVDGSIISANSDDTTPVSDVRKLKKIQIFPRNRVYQTRTQSVQDRFYCLAFYSDNTVEDVSRSVTFNAAANATTDDIKGSSFSTAPGNEGVLTIDRGAATYIRLTASLNSNPSQTDSTAVEAASQ